MDHIVYLDAKANELEKLTNSEKSMIIRGATGRKMPYGRVNSGKGETCIFILSLFANFCNSVFQFLTLDQLFHHQSAFI